MENLVWSVVNRVFFKVIWTCLDASTERVQRLWKYGVKEAGDDMNVKLKERSRVLEY